MSHVGGSWRERRNWWKNAALPRRSWLVAFSRERDLQIVPMVLVQSITSSLMLRYLWVERCYSVHHNFEIKYRAYCVRSRSGRERPGSWCLAAVPEMLCSMMPQWPGTNTNTILMFDFDRWWSKLWIWLIKASEFELIRFSVFRREASESVKSKYLVGESARARNYK